MGDTRWHRSVVICVDADSNTLTSMVLPSVQNSAVSAMSAVVVERCVDNIVAVAPVAFPLQADGNLIPKASGTASVDRSDNDPGPVLSSTQPLPLKCVARFA